jgi:hypothetical protein
MEKNIFAIIFLSLFIIPSILAMGVANSYWDEKPLKLAPGESTTISLRLQNEGTEPVRVGVSVDSPFVSLVDGNEYEVPPNKVSMPVYLDVEIPEDAEIGTGYAILVSFKEVTSGEGGMLRVAQGITGKVPLEIVGEEESELYGEPQGISTRTTIIIVALIIIALLIIINAYVRKKKG